MSITVNEATIESMKVTKDDKGAQQISGSYSLITTDGMTLCKSKFGDDYGDIKIPYSQETIQLMLKLSKSVSKDIELSIGIKEQEDVK